MGEDIETQWLLFCADEITLALHSKWQVYWHLVAVLLSDTFSIFDWWDRMS